jgi:hypothetical protein
MTYQIGTEIIWMGTSDRRDGKIKKYTIGTIKGVYESGLLIEWNLDGTSFSDLIKFSDLGFKGMFLPLLSEFQDSQQQLLNFQKNVLPLMLGTFYPIRRNTNKFAVLPLIQNLDRHHKNRKR